MEPWQIAIRAAQGRKALDLTMLDVGKVSTFTERFLICHGTNSRQVQAIADAVQRDLKAAGWLPFSVEGYRNAEWILLDYGDFVMHVFSPEKRFYYDLERLWRTAPRLPVPAVSPMAVPVASEATAAPPTQTANSGL